MWHYFILFFSIKCSSVCTYYICPITQSTIYTITPIGSTFHDHVSKLWILDQPIHATSRSAFTGALVVAAKSKKSSFHGGAAIGFGSSATTRRNKDSIGDNLATTPPRSDVVANDGTTNKLDKWGLPPPTIEDIFPLMSNCTEIIPVDPTIHYTVNDIQNYLNDSYPNNINWDYVTTSQRQNNTNIASFGPPKMLLRLAHRSPPVLIIDNFLSEDECNDVQRIVTENDNAAEGNDTVIRVASKTISQQLALSKRTSTSWFCSYKSIPTVLAKIQHVLGINDLSRCEEPQIVQYDIGQEFTYHYDVLPKEQSINGGQRVATILIYLNTISETNGGSTTFRDLIDGYNKNSTLSVQPVQGSALIFFPSNQCGQPDDRTLHRSLPIVEDRTYKRSSSNRFSASKWILQIWIHETSYTACLPSKQNRIEDAYKGINVASSQLGYISKV